MTPSEPATPEDVMIYAREGDYHRRLVVSMTTMPAGDVVIHRTRAGATSLRPSDPGAERDYPAILVLDPDNARHLADALQWAARIADPGSPDPEPPTTGDLPG